MTHEVLYVIVAINVSFSIGIILLVREIRMFLRNEMPRRRRLKKNDEVNKL